MIRICTLSFCIAVSLSSAYAQFNLPDDCIGAIILCDGGDVAFNPVGGDIDDFADPDNDSGCLLNGENNSAWYYVEIDLDAPADLELGFTVTPGGGAGEDYDFAVWGPDVSCTDLGDPIRCSYAGPGCSFCPQTGLGMGETDTSEDPSGNGFVSTITVQPGEGYYIMIDNFSPSGNGFNMEFTGDAADWLTCENDPPCSIDLILDESAGLCQGADPLDILLTINGNDAPYTINWVGDNGGTAFLSDPTAESPTVTLPADFSGIINYEVTVEGASGNCTTLDTIVLTVNEQPVVSIDGLMDLCPSDSPITLTGEPSGGVWSGSIAADGTIDPSVQPAGINTVSYMYTDDLGCSNEITETYQIFTIPDIAIDPVDPLCSDGDPIDLVAVPAGGVWSVPVAGTTLTPSDLDIGPNTLTYTITTDEGCVDSADIMIELRDPVQSQIIGPEFLCTNGDPVNYDGQLPGGTWEGVIESNGVFNPSLFPSGVYDIIYSSPPADCHIDAVLTVTVNDPPFAVVTTEITVCNSGDTEINLDDLVTGGDMTGTWTEVTTSGATGSLPMQDFQGVPAGVYSYTYSTASAALGCEESMYGVLVFVEDCACPSLAVIDPDSICISDANIDLDSLLITTEEGSWTLISGPDAGNPATVTGSSFSGTDADTGLYVLRYTLASPVMDCPDSTEIDIYLSAPTTLDMMLTLSACNTSGSGSFPAVLDLYDAITGGDTTGSWLAVDAPATSGDFDQLDFTDVLPGMYRYVYTTAAGVAPCEQISDTLTIDVQDCNCPMLSISPFPSACSDEVSIDLSDSLSADGAGSWRLISSPGMPDDASLSGSVLAGSDVAPGDYVIAYILDDAPPAGCPDSIATTITIVAQAEVLLRSSLMVCNNSTSTALPSSYDLDTAIISGNVTGIWTDDDDSGAVGSDGVFNFQDVPPGNYSFTFTSTDASAPCEDITSSLMIEVVDCQCPSVALSSLQVACGDDVDVSLDLLNISGNTGTWEVISDPGDGNPATIVGNRLTGMNIDPGSYILEFTLDDAVPEGCPTSNTVEVQVNEPEFAALPETVDICNTNEQGNTSRINFLTLITAGSRSGTWEDLDGSGASGVLPLIDFDGVAPGSYDFRYSLSAEFPCDDFEAIITVRVAECLCPSIDVTDISALCTSETSFDLSQLLGASTTGRWELRGASGASIAGDELDLSSATAGSYTLVFFTDAVLPADCPDSVRMPLQLDAPASAGNYLGDRSVCRSDGPVIMLADQLTAADGGGLWTTTSTDPVVISALDAATGQLDIIDLPADAYTFTYTVDPANACAPAEIDVRISIIAAPVISLPATATLDCDNPSLSIGIAPEDGISYSWTLDGTVISEMSMITASAPGVYVLEARTAQGCSTTASVDVSSVATITEILTTVTQPSCLQPEGGFVRIDEIVGGESPYSFTLNGEEVDLTQNLPLAPDDYVLTVSDATGCSLSTTFTIASVDGIAVDLGEDREIEAGDPLSVDVNITMGSPDSIVWFLGDSLICVGCAVVDVSPSSSTSLTVLAFTDEGCTASSMISIRVVVNRLVFVPNVFSPNSDGTNDIWTILTDDGVETIERVAVYDRWGSLVYTAQDLTPGVSWGWDGIAKDQLLPSGVYVYTAQIRFTDGFVQVYSGDVTLVR